MASLKVGIAQVDITPATGLPLVGNFRDDYPAKGVHDPLWAKAMVFADEQGSKAAILALDLCFVDRDNVALIRRELDALCDLPPDSVLIHATHTHSGPATNGKFLFGYDFEPHRLAVEVLLRKAATAVAQADRQLLPATLVAGCSEERRLSFNRRLRRRDGTTQMNWDALAPGFKAQEVAEAWGPTDPQVTCVGIQQEGRLAAALVNFGLHPAILAGDNWLYSSDYPGYLAEGLARIEGEDFRTLFLNGCCGNVNHVDYRDAIQGRGYAMTQRVGYMLAASAAEALRRHRLVEIPRIAVSREMVELPRIQISDEDRRHYEAVLEASRRQPLQGQVDGLPEAFFADLRLQMHRVQDRPDLVEVMVLRLGELAVVGLPGETFCELGMQIKRGSPVPFTIVCGLANDAIGYLPTRESFVQGGYEVTVGSTVYEPGAGERLAESASRQLQRLFAPSDQPNHR